jgi:hypothetical protein
MREELQGARAFAYGGSLIQDADPSAPIETKKHRNDWTTLLRDLDRLHARN